MTATSFRLTVPRRRGVRPRLKDRTLCLVPSQEQAVEEAWDDFIDIVGHEAIEAALEAASKKNARRMKFAFRFAVAENAGAALGECFATTAALVGFVVATAVVFQPAQPLGATAVVFQPAQPLGVAVGCAALILAAFLAVQIHAVWSWWFDFSQSEDVLASVRRFYTDLAWKLPVGGLVAYTFGTIGIASLVGVKLLSLQMAATVTFAVFWGGTVNLLYFIRLKIAAELPAFLPQLRAMEPEVQAQVEAIRADSTIMKLLQRRWDLGKLPIYFVYLLAQGLWGLALGGVVLFEVVAIAEGTTKGLVAVTFMGGMIVVALSHAVRFVNSQTKAHKRIWQDAHLRPISVSPQRDVRVKRVV